MELGQRWCGAGKEETSVHMELCNSLVGEGGRGFFMHRELKRGHSRWGAQPGQGAEVGPSVILVGRDWSPTPGDLLWVSPQGRRKTFLLLMCWEG